MNLEHLPFLCCPKTGQKLTLEIFEKNGNQVLSGLLHTTDRLQSYPIIRGIPRFINEEYYSNSFGYEWNIFPRIQFEDENIGKPMEGHTKKMFHIITGIKPEEMNGKKYIEFGCGPRRFLDIILKNGGIAVGLDLSMAVESAYDNLGNNPNVLIVQGDVLSPPFPQNFFDGGYSIGVFHHTPDPECGVRSLCSVVKNEGRIAASVYPQIGLYHAYSTLHTRKIMVALRKKIGEKIGYKVAMAYSKVSAYLFYPLLLKIRKIPCVGDNLVSIITENFCVVTFIPDKKWRILDTFDAITPEYASTHTSQEVRDWLIKAGCKDISQSDWGETSFQAVKI